MIQKEIKQGKADLHVHSLYSKDALSSIESILEKAKKAQLDLIAITDHDTIEGAKEAKKMAPYFGLDVIIGEEIKTKEGDIIALFIQEAITSGRFAFETLKEIHSQGGLAIAPHPNNWFLEGISAKNLLRIFNHLDGIEILNGSWAGRIGREEISKLNKLIFNLAPIGASDAHLARQVGCSYTIFKGKNSTDLYKAIQQRLTMPGGRKWTYKDNLLWLINTPRIFYRSPRTLKEGAKKIIKKGLKRAIKRRNS